MYTYYASGRYWIECSGHGIGSSVTENFHIKSMYVHLTGNHFEAVTSVRNRVVRVASSIDNLILLYYHFLNLGFRRKLCF